jgi:hypothetical protein
MIPQYKRDYNLRVKAERNQHALLNEDPDSYMSARGEVASPRFEKEFDDISRRLETFESQEKKREEERKRKEFSSSELSATSGENHTGTLSSRRALENRKPALPSRLRRPDCVPKLKEMSPKNHIPSSVSGRRNFLRNPSRDNNKPSQRTHSTRGKKDTVVTGGLRSTDLELGHRALHAKKDAVRMRGKKDLESSDSKRGSAKKGYKSEQSPDKQVLRKILNDKKPVDISPPRQY